MKKPRRDFHIWFAALVFLGITLSTVGLASAEWYWVHGHSASLEKKDVTDYWAGESFEYGWGLDIRQKPGTSNWVHFAVPTLGNTNKGARYIKLRFYTGNADAVISDVHIWNGGEKVRAFKVDWSDGWQTRTLDLERVVSFPYGLGISVKINAGDDTYTNYRFILSGAGANFVKK